MAHRDVRSALYGIVAGIVLGAGSLGYAQFVSLTANEIPIPAANLHDAASPLDYTARNIKLRGVPLRNDGEVNEFPTIKSSSSSSSSSVAPDANASSTCDTVRNAITRIQIVYQSVIPASFKYTDIRQKMDAAFAAVLQDNCPMMNTSSSMSSSTSSVSAVDNHCNKYPLRSPRYTQCVLAQQFGKAYP